MMHSQPQWTRDQDEQLGTKEKFWVRDQNDVPWLFKKGRAGTGEDWAEVVCSRIADLLQLPHAEYEPGDYEGRRGVFTRSVLDASAGDRLVHGNELIARVVDHYPKELRSNTAEYTLQRVRQALINSELPIVKTDATYTFGGYLVFDCLVGNQDRHHENWAVIIRSDGSAILSPSFDHAAGLACRLSDDERYARLNTRDSGYAVDSFARSARTPFHAEGSTRAGRLSTLEAVRLWRSWCPQIDAWINRAAFVDSASLLKVYDGITEEVMSTVTKKFVTMLVEVNRKRLLEVACN